MNSSVTRGLRLFGLLCAAVMATGFAPSAVASSAPSTIPAYLDAIEKLGAFGKLPDGTWRVHVGDIAHAEAPDLDDSGWATPATWKPTSDSPLEAVWFRQTYTIPKTLGGYDLTGAKIWFQFPQDNEIIYFNGRRVALGEALEPIVLFDHAKPGDTVVVAVKVLHAVSAGDFKRAILRIEYPSLHPSPTDIREELQAAVVLVPSLAPGDQGRMDALADVASTIDFAALAAHDQARFDASLKATQAKLETFTPSLRQGVFHVVGQSHMDAAWLWPWTETVDVVRRTFASSLQLMYEYPQYTYTQSAAQYYEWMAQKYPDMNAEIGRRIKEGRWEAVGGMWVEPDLNMPDGESLVRQLLVGKRWFKQAYGVDVKIGWNPDSFGYTLQLPQIYKKSGVDYFVTTKMGWNDTNQIPFSLFWWQAPDGSKVLTYLAMSLTDNLDPSRLSNDLAVDRKHVTNQTELMDLYGVGDHGGGPTRVSIDEGLHYSDPDLVLPKYEFGTAKAFFDTVEPTIAPDSPSWSYASIAKGYKPPAAVPGKIAIPTWTSDLYLEYHRGVYTGQANQKRNNRDAEVAMLNAEKWSSLAWLDGQAYPGAELTEDWKKVLFNQFHDLLPGSGINVIYKDAQKDYDGVRWSTDEISAKALASLSAQVDTRAKAAAVGAVPVVVFNPLGWTRSGEVTVRLQLPKAAPVTGRLEVLDANGRPTPIGAEVMSSDPATGAVDLRLHAEDVPPLGYKVFQVLERPAKPLAKPEVALSTTAETYTLEDAALRVVIDKATGCISEIFDKRSGFETLAKGACGNQLQAYRNQPHQYDAWNIDPGTYAVAPTIIDKVDAIASQNFAGHPAVRISRAWQNSTFVQTIMLDTTMEAVTVDNDIDWHESHILLKAAFPLAATSPFATFEVPYGTIQRPTTRNNSWEKAQFEVPALRWGDISNDQHGASLINSSKYGYDAVGDLLRLTLLRSAKSPDPEADMGRHRFRYALYPHAGDWKTALTERRGYEFNYPLTAVAAMAHPGPLPASHSFASMEAGNVVLTAVKKAEDSNALVFRAYEWAGKEAVLDVHVPPGATGATLTNMQETPEGAALPLAGDVVKAPIHPYEILTLRVDYPNVVTAAH